MPPIRGISRTSLWNTWKIVRKDLRNGSIRDVIDFADYDIDPVKWIDRLVIQIATGRYEPSAPLRFTLGKSNGFSRTMTQPTIPDLILYRTIVDLIYLKAFRREHSHVFFKREKLQQAQTATISHTPTVSTHWPSHYRLTSKRSFHNWLKFDQYRKFLLLKAVHPFIVVTDITNFFDSILHSHVEEAMRGLPLMPRIVGLLLLLVERLSVRPDYSSSHRISLPIDEFDCSRTLAHMTLFTHDDRMVEFHGEDNYVRWMDDQNIGTSSRADGLRVLSRVGSSLAQLHLSPNNLKSKILTLKEASEHFHLDLNARLDSLEAMMSTCKTARDRRALATRLRVFWRAAAPGIGQGEFDKVLKRFYRLAGYARVRFLRIRTHRDVLNNPSLADRICDYVRCSGTVQEYLSWMDNLMNDPEQIYADVNVTLIENLLRLEPTAQESRIVRTLAVSLLSPKSVLPGAAGCRAIAPLLILRFGDRRQLPLLRRCFTDERATADLLRASAVVFASYGDAEFRQVKSEASILLNNHLAMIVKLVNRIRIQTDVPARYIARLDLRYDSVGRTSYVDMRALLTLRLLHQSHAPRVVQWVGNWKKRTLRKSISSFDRSLINKLI